MKIEFDGIADLREFLEFAGYEKRAGERYIGKRPELAAPYGESAAPNEHYPDRAPWPGDSAQHEAHVAATGALMTTEDLERAIAGAPRDKLAACSPSAEAAFAAAATQTEPEPPKRKRRTKAEIEADKAAASAPVVETPAPSDAQATAATSPLAGANPFDASTSNAPAATAALNEAPAGTTGTLSALAIGEAAHAAIDSADVDPQTYMQLRVAEMGGTFDPREHMKKCVEFIGALGKAKYDEAFTLAGTSRAVASYTPADCAKHIAALEYLQIAG